jgi:hypothetical protein
MRDQVENLSARLKKAGHDEDLVPAAENLVGKLTSIEEKLMQTKNETSGDTSNFPPRLDSQLIRILGLTVRSQHKPTDGVRARFDDLKPELSSYLEELEDVVNDDLAAFNDLVREKNVAPVFVPR